MKGSYLLLLQVKEKKKIRIGALGEIEFKPGIYCYVGSAMNNIEKRIERYLRINKEKTGKLRWHIDYLLADKDTKIIDWIKVPSKEKIECKFANKIKEISDGYIPNFGSSDCKCKSHLFYFKNKERLKKIRNTLSYL